MLIINGKIHDGIGKVFERDLRIRDGIISSIGEKLCPEEGEEVFDAAGMEILPGFIQTISGWGVNGSMTEIRPSSNDNDEKSSPIMPELDAFYAFNGRAASAQQLGAFGLTACGVAPTDNNLFGGLIAAFEVDGLNPYKMVLGRELAMMASVTNNLKKTYGSRQIAPMTRMWIYTNFAQQLRKAAEYKKEEGKPADDKLAALKRVIDGELPLYVACDSKTAISHVLDITGQYPRLRLGIINGYELDGSEEELIEKQIPVIVRTASMAMDEYGMRLNPEGIQKLLEKGALISLSGSDSVLGAREDCLWNAVEMMRLIHDSEKVLPMITSNPAKILGIDDITGSVEEGKRADLVIWSADPLKTWTARIIRTYQKGRIIYREGDALKCM